MAANALSNFRFDIQALRALAVLLVVGFHFDVPGVSGGFIGVDIFYVISGYLISSLLMRELEEKGTVDLSAFYARRIKRLLPSAVLVFLVTIFAVTAVYSPHETRAATSSSIASLSYLSNFWFALNATDYLNATSSEDPFLHSWSLAVEEQFYLIWPIIFFLMWKFKNRKRAVLIGLSCLTIVSFVCGLVVIQWNQPWAFFMSPLRAWEFSLGAIVLLVKKNSSRRFLSEIFLLTGFFTILGAAYFYSNSTFYPGAAALLPVIGTCAMLHAGENASPANAIIGRLVRTDFVQLIGNVSYSWYLWHWPVAVLLHELRYDSPLEKFYGILMSFVLALLTLYLIENPVRRMRRLTTASYTTIVYGMGISAVAIALAYSVPT